MESADSNLKKCEIDQSGLFMDACKASGPDIEGREHGRLLREAEGAW